MREYEVCYKDGTSQEIEVADRKELVNRLFNGSEDKLKNQVVLLKWQTANMFFTEDVASGKIESQITTADVNPYGWRNEVEGDSFSIPE
ncbi:MAG: hypothetical protein AAF843_08760 [Bacteroidota bacterium]